MTDITSNITIDITGNTADMVTDYGTDGTGFTAAHVSAAKVIWGDTTESFRTNLTNPLPIQFAGQTETTTVSGSFNAGGAGSTAFFPVVNYGGGPGVSAGALHYIAVAGSTNGVTPVGVTGQIQGIIGGEAIAITGDVIVRPNGNAMQQSGLAIQGTTAGVTADIEGEVYPGYGFGVPVAITAGRRLDSNTDSVTVSGTISSTGGRQLSPSTDSVSCYGYDQGRWLYTRMYGSGGETLGVSGDGANEGALKVAVVNGNFNISATVASEVGITNAGMPPLRIQGYTAGGGHDPVTVRGENAGALEIVATSALSTTVQNTVTIDDDDIINSLESSDKPIMNALDDIKHHAAVIGSIKSDLTNGNVKANIISITKPTSLRSGSKRVTSTTSQLHTNLEMKSGVTIKSGPLSQSNILIGNNGLLTSNDNGYLLEPGESIFIEINNINKIYVKLAGSGSGASVYYIGT